MRRKIRHSKSMFFALLSIAIVFCVCTFYFSLSEIKQPNTFLYFSATKSGNYGIRINDSIVTNSKEIEKMSYSNKIYERKSKDIALNVGSNTIEIVDFTKNETIARTKFSIAETEKKYIYIRFSDEPEIEVKDEPYILI